MEVNSVFFNVARIMQTPVCLGLHSHCTKVNFHIWKLLQSALQGLCKCANCNPLYYWPVPHSTPGAKFLSSGC